MASVASIHHTSKPVEENRGCELLSRQQRNTWLPPVQPARNTEEPARSTESSLTLPWSLATVPAHTSPEHTSSDNENIETICEETNNRRIPQHPEQQQQQQQQRSSASRKALDMSLRSLTVLPNEIYNLSSTLETLNITSNLLVTLPHRTRNLCKLRTLNVSWNQLKSIPNGVLGQLHSLETLNIGWNRLTTLPEDIGRCKSLKEITANDNLLVKLPDRIGDCCSLESINVQYNQLRNLPSSLLQLCATIEVLMLTGNNFDNDRLAQDVLRTSSPQEILESLSIAVRDLKCNLNNKALQFFPPL
eukprot:GHVQ01018183.1.p1 GENE.GHVQ01018183.1~~GHVQ01018183.1.p1  ORF type:complete len:329 (+),score=46.08 GHVQ01018183.1:77-988(+)